MSAATDAKRYHVVCIIDPVAYYLKWKVDPPEEKVHMTSSPVNHNEGCVVLRKQVPHTWCRYVLEET